MNIKLFAKVATLISIILIGIFILFLLTPFILNFFIDKHIPQIAGFINKYTGLSAGLEDVKIVSTPKLTAGLKIKKFELYTPNKEPIFIADDFDLKVSLIPLLTKHIQIDVIKLEKADVTLKFNKDRDLDFIKYLPISIDQQTSTEEEKQEEKNTINTLPLGLKLSNKLPNVYIGSCSVNITDGIDNYILKGDKTYITDFIFNKSIKIKSSGKITLKNREHFNYKVNLFNKIMPDEDLNEFVFNPQNENKKEKEPQKVDIIAILNGLYDYNVTLNTDLDLKTSKDTIDGSVNINNVSIINLPKSKADLIFKGNNINIDSNIYTAKNEVSTIKGNITTGKKTNLDINVKSNVEISNLMNIVKKFALIFNIEDLKTLTANGQVNADFNIKSDLKMVKSNGFLKIPLANIYYGAYKIGVDNINADIVLNNNNVNLKNLSFSILGQPMKLFGTISSNADIDIQATANKLDLKGLLVALGQASIMKDNPVYSGNISMNAIVKGKPNKINPIIKLNILDVDLRNIPLDIRLKAPNTTIDISSDGKTFDGNAVSNGVRLVNPALTVYAPQIKANILPDNIEITKTPVNIEKNNATISGKITNYLTEVIGLDFISTGDIQSTLKGDMNIQKQTLALTYATTDLSTIVIPGFDKSKLSFKGKINITGNMMNPIISGSATVPSVSIPEIPTTMTDMDIKLNGTILHGTGTVKEFTSGGIIAESLTSDFELNGAEFYLNNLKGTAFGGKVNGDIVYNISNAKTKLNFKGTGLNAERAIEGTIGIKNALSGTLGFDTKLTLTVLEYSEMIKSIKGDLVFDIKKGAFGTIGRFEGFLGASNIVENYFLKNTVNALSNAVGLATTAQFDILDGSLTLNNGWANLNPIKSAGQSLCYYITGKYNLINGTTNVNILGRLDAPMVAKLGPIGSLNMSNLIGDKAASVVKILTSNPQTEKTELIPTLTNKSTNYQDFKVVFNGGVDSKSSIKSFKWLKNADMSDLTPQTAKDIVDSVKDAYKTDINMTKEEWNNTVEQKKKEINDIKEQINTTKDDFKNLWKSFKDVPKQENNETPVEKTESLENNIENVESSQSENVTE